MEDLLELLKIRMSVARVHALGDVSADITQYCRAWLFFSRTMETQL